MYKRQRKVKIVPPEIPKDIFLTGLAYCGAIFFSATSVIFDAEKIAGKIFSHWHPDFHQYNTVVSCYTDAKRKHIYVQVGFKQNIGKAESGNEKNKPTNRYCGQQSIVLKAQKNEDRL
jgi:hypothetical protein